MKKKFKIIVTLTLIMSTLLAMFTSVSADTTPSGNFNTLNIPISGTIKTDNKISEETKDGDTYNWWLRFNTGTRYVLRIGGVEVPEKYYINHIKGENNNDIFFSGTNVSGSGELVKEPCENSYSNLIDIIKFGTEYTHVTNWVNGEVDNFGLSSDDTSKIIEAVNKLAKDDSEWQQMTDEEYLKKNPEKQIEIRAEILIQARPVQKGTSNYYYMTYNEIRKTAMASGKLSQMGLIRNNGLDALACKLYEKDEPYSVIRDENNEVIGVNCSCNYLKQGGTNLAPLHSGYTWELTKLSGRNDTNITFHYNSESPYGTEGGFVTWPDGSIRYLANYNKNGSKNFQIDMLVPNICSIKIGKKYYTMGMSKDSNGKTIGNGIEFIPARGKDLQFYSSTGTIYQKAPLYSYLNNSSISIPNFDTSNDTAYVFEGWDYIVNTTSKEIYKNTYTVVEYWLCNNNEINNYSHVVTSVTAGETYDVIGVKDISGYEYLKSEYRIRGHEGTWAENWGDYRALDQEKFTVNNDMQIVHNYRKEYTVTEYWLYNGINIATPQETRVTEDDIYNVIGVKDIAGYAHWYSVYKFLDEEKYSSLGDTTTFTVTKNMQIVHNYRKEYTVTEYWLYNGKEIPGYPHKETRVTEGETYNVIGVKDISGYEHWYSTYRIREPGGDWSENWRALDQKKFTVSNDMQIVHKYKPIQTYTVVEYWLCNNNEINNYPHVVTSVTAGETYDVIGVKDISGYEYLKSEYRIRGHEGTWAENWGDYRALDQEKFTVNNDMQIVHEYELTIPTLTYTVTEYWLCGDDEIPNYPHVVTSVTAGETYNVIGKKDITGYKYWYSTYRIRGHEGTWAENWGDYCALDQEKFTVNNDMQIVHIYKPTYTVVEYWLCNNAEILPDYPHKETPVTAGETYNVIGKKDISGCKHLYSTYRIREHEGTWAENWGDYRALDQEKFTVNNDMQIIHNYEPYEPTTIEYNTVTIRYIADGEDEKSQSTIKTISTSVAKGTIFPSNGTIKKGYAVEKPQGQWGKTYKYYELDKSKVVVDGKEYAYDKIPDSIKVDENKTIEFHYKLKPAELKINVFVVLEIDVE